MSKTMEPILQEIRSRPFTVIVQVVGLLVIILNIWLVSKLAPIQQGVAIAESNIGQLERRIDRLSDRLDRIENKIDVLISR